MEQEPNEVPEEEPKIDTGRMHEAEYAWAERQVDFERLRKYCKAHHLV